MCRLRWMLAAMVALSLGCFRFPVLEYPPSAPIWTDDEMYLVPMRDPAALFLRHPQTQLSEYTAVMLDDIQISYKPGQKKPPRHREDRLKDRCGSLLLRTSAWELADAPGPGVLRARLAVKNVVTGPPTHLPVNTMVPVSSSGEVTMILELRDSVKRDRVMLFAQRRTLPIGLYYPGNIPFERVEDAFYLFAVDARRFVHRAERGVLRVPRPPGELPERCVRCHADSVPAAVSPGPVRHDG